MYRRRRRDYGSTLSKSMYASVGAGLILYETSIDLLKDLLDAGRIAPEEGRRIIDDVADRLEGDERYLYEGRDNGGYHKERMHREFATKDDINDIKAQLAKLSEKLENKEAGTHSPAA